MIGDAKVPFSTVKEVKCADNTATIEFFTNFIEGTEFFVEYDNKVVGSFTAIKLNASSVAAVVIPNQEVYNNKLTDIKFTLIDENGIDITPILKNAAFGGYMQFTLVNAPADAFATDSQVYISKAGESYEIIGKYNWYVDGNPQSKEGQGVITSVEAPKEAMESYVASLTKETKNTKGDASKNIKTLALGDTGVYAQVFFKYINCADADKERTLSTNTYGTPNGYLLQVADESVVMLGAVKDDAVEIITNKVGSTTILIYSPEDNNHNRAVLGVLPVTVKDTRKATSFEVKALDNKLTLNGGYDNDKVRFSAVVYDQYSEVLNIPSDWDDWDGTLDYVTIEQVDFTKKTAVLDLTEECYGFNDATKKYDIITFYGDALKNGVDSDKISDGAITLKFTYDNKAGVKLEQTLAISVTNKADAATYKLTLSKNSLDTSVKNDTKTDWITVSLDGVTSNGFAAPGTDIYNWNQNDAPKSSAATGDAITYVYTVTKDGKMVVNADNVYSRSFASVVSKSSTTYTATGAACKLAAGNYVVTAYKIDANEKATVVTVVGTQTFTVTNNQVEPTMEMKAESIAKSAAGSHVAMVAELNKAFEFKYSFNNGGKTAAIDFDYTINEAASKVYVKSAKVIIDNANVGVYESTVTIGLLIDLK